MATNLQNQKSVFINQLIIPIAVAVIGGVISGIILLYLNSYDNKSMPGKTAVPPNNNISDVQPIPTETKLDEPKKKVEKSDEFEIDKDPRNSDTAQRASAQERDEDKKMDKRQEIPILEDKISNKDIEKEQKANPQKLDEYIFGQEI
jgi:hypothetical protein